MYPVFNIHLNSFHQWLMMPVCVCVCAFIGLKVGSLICFQDPTIDYSANSELKKLQFFGAGPKAAVPPNPKGQSHTCTHTCGTCTHTHTCCDILRLFSYLKRILLTPKASSTSAIFTDGWFLWYVYAVIHTLLCGAILIYEEKKVSVNSDGNSYDLHWSLLVCTGYNNNDMV